MLKISHAGCLGLSSVISAQFTREMCRSLKSWKIHQNPLFLGFMVAQGYRCWYHPKGRQQCLLWLAASLSATVLTLDKPIPIAVK